MRGMTTTDTLPDRELDVWLAEHLFGFTADELTRGSGPFGLPWPPSYSSTGDGMLLVLEAMRGRGFTIDFEVGGGVVDTAQTYTEVNVYSGRADYLTQVATVTGTSVPRVLAEAARAALEA